MHLNIIYSAFVDILPLEIIRTIFNVFNEKKSPLRKHVFKSLLKPTFIRYKSWFDMGKITANVTVVVGTYSR